MNLGDISDGFRQLWESRPGAILLLFLGFLVFVFLVVDAWKHKRRRRRPQVHHHH